MHVVERSIGGAQYRNTLLAPFADLEYNVSIGDAAVVSIALHDRANFATRRRIVPAFVVRLQAEQAHF